MPHGITLQWKIAILDVLHIPIDLLIYTRSLFNPPERSIYLCLAMWTSATFKCHFNNLNAKLFFPLSSEKTQSSSQRGRQEKLSLFINCKENIMTNSVIYGALCWQFLGVIFYERATFQGGTLCKSLFARKLCNLTVDGTWHFSA